MSALQDTAYDLVIIGTGMGGGTLAYALRNAGARILLIERGDYLPQEPENWDPEAVFLHNRYKAKEVWHDANGQSFKPGVHYYVGGNTKVYGAAFPRLREQDFDDLEHEGGTAPAWPINYATLAPYYDEAEHIFKVHGRMNDDPNGPPRNQPFPFPEVPHEPFIADVADRLRKQGRQPFYLPLGIDLREGGRCIRCQTCDGYPCKVLAKSDADVCCVRPALQSPDVTLITRTYARRLLRSADDQRIEAVEVERDGEVFTIRADRFVVSCGAVNSAALFWRSGDGDAPIANSSGQVGRNYMVHNNTALMAIAPFRHNTAVFQKTLAINDFYFGSPSFPYPMGNLQFIGKIQAPMLAAIKPNMPRSVLAMMAGRSVDWWVMSEDLPDPENRVTITDDGTPRIHWTPNNLVAHRKLTEAAEDMLKAAGFTVTFTQPMTIATNSHQCGTMRFGTDPVTAVLDPLCRTYDYSNLYVMDASFFPSSTAVNPALTIAAQALRVAERIGNG